MELKITSAPTAFKKTVLAQKKQNGPQGYTQQNFTAPSPSAQSYLAQKNISFKSLMRFNLGDDMMPKPLDSAFYRDASSLEVVSKELSKNFEKGTTIYNFASSNGEEANSLYGMLNNDKYKIKGFDIEDEGLQLAKNGVHSVFSNFVDDFLIKEDSALSPKQLEYKKQFYKMFENTQSPEEPLNNSPEFAALKMETPNFKEEFFKLKDEYKDKISYEQGDIFEIDKIEPGKKVGAILFRNAFYQIFNNYFEEDLSRKLSGAINGIDIDEAVVNLLQDEAKDRNAMAQEIVEKIYDKLEVGGIFAMGDHSKEFLYAPNSFDSPQNIVPLSQTPLYSKILEKTAKHLEEYKAAAIPKYEDLPEEARQNMDKEAFEDFIKIAMDFSKNLPDKDAAMTTVKNTLKNVNILAKSPVQLALEKNGKFKPIAFAEVDAWGCKMKMPTVWKKIA